MIRKAINKIKLTDLVPVFILIFITVFFTMLTNGSLLSSYNLENIVNQSIATIIAGLGMIFAVSMGGTDVSTGVVVVISAIFSVRAANAIGAAATFPAAILVGTVTGLFVGVLNAKFKIKSFMITLAMNVSLRALANLLLGASTLQMGKYMRNLVNGWQFKIAALIFLIALITYLFNYTPFGLYVKSIGENEEAVKYAGVNVTKMKILAFMISGIMAGIAGVFTVARVGGVNNTLGSSFEMRVMMALFIGGIPVNGGMGSKISKLIMGAPMIMLLESGLVLCGVSGSVTQGVRGLVLLGAVMLTRVLDKHFTSMNTGKAEKGINQKKNLYSFGLKAKT